MGANTARCGRRSRVPRAAAAEVVTATVPQATALPELPPLDGEALHTSRGGEREVQGMAG